MFVLVASLVAHVVADELYPSSLFGLFLASESEQDYGCKTWSWWLQRGCLKPGYELGFLYLRGYKTWLQNLVLLNLDTTPERPARLHVGGRARQQARRQEHEQVRFNWAVVVAQR